jgi:hypothetical protein
MLLHALELSPEGRRGAGNTFGEWKKKDDVWKKIS